MGASGWGRGVRRHDPCVCADTPPGSTAAQSQMQVVLGASRVAVRWSTARHILRALHCFFRNESASVLLPCKEAAACGQPGAQGHTLGFFFFRPRWLKAKTGSTVMVWSHSGMGRSGCTQVSLQHPQEYMGQWSPHIHLLLSHSSNMCDMSRVTAFVGFLLMISVRAFIPLD